MGYNLIDSFREQGWDFLIPVHLEKTVSGDYVDFENVDDSGHSNLTGRDFGEYEPEIWDEESDYFDDYDYEMQEDEDDDTDDIVPVSRSPVYFDRPETLYDLKYELDCDSVPDDEFLSMSAGELFGITNAQLKFISQKAIQCAGIGRYRDKLLAKTDIESIEQRIRYVNVISQVSFATLCLFGVDDTPENRVKYEDYLRKIAFKKNENDAVQLIKWHMDYMRMRPMARIINDEHRRDGEPYFNYVLFPKTNHIKDLHDKAVRDFSTLKSREAEEHKAESNRLISAFINTPKYKKYLYRGDVYSVISVNSVEDIIHEADALKHCVASYINDFAKGKSYLYFIRRSDSLKNSLYTVELLETSSGRMKMSQCYGYRDTIDKEDDLRQFIYQWCRIKSIRIDCPV